MFIGLGISRAQLGSVLEQVDRAIGQGAKLLLGSDPGAPAGLALPPQVLARTKDVATAREEVYRPAITIIEAHGDEHALRLANDTEYELSSPVHTADAGRGAVRAPAADRHDPRASQIQPVA